MKRMIIILVILALGGFGAFRAAQVISARKEEPKRQATSPAPLVEVASVIQGLVEEKISRAGDIMPNTQVTIYSKVQGWVDKINVREGDLVKAGDILVTLDSREAQAAVAQAQANLEAVKARLQLVRATAEEAVQSQIRQAKANLELAEADLKRAQELYEKNFIARQQLDEARTKYNVAKSAYDLAFNNLQQKTWEKEIALAEAQVRQAKATLELTQAQLNNLTILSPLNGGVTKRYVDPGTMVKDTTPILTIMDLAEVKMVVNVTEREFVRLKKDQPVKVLVTAFPERIFPGRIEIITPALELQSRTAEIQIAIPNPGYILKPGMFGRVEITLRSQPQAVLVPIQAVLNEDNKDYVFVIKEGRAFRRSIQKGLIKDTAMEVIQGLYPGELVVVSGHRLLQEGIAVKIAAKQEKEGEK
ncbi:MAG: efflux RND transporter periplasmic adaptor subunit [Thermodesulfobacteriota bacterium]